MPSPLFTNYAFTFPPCGIKHVVARKRKGDSAHVQEYQLILGQGQSSKPGFFQTTPPWTTGIHRRKPFGVSEQCLHKTQNWIPPYNAAHILEPKWITDEKVAVLYSSFSKSSMTHLCSRKTVYVNTSLRHIQHSTGARQPHRRHWLSSSKQQIFIYYYSAQSCSQALATQQWTEQTKTPALVQT